MHARPTTERDARQCWATPAALVRGVERLSGVPIILDVCAKEWSAKAPAWLGPGSPIAEDGLTADWWGLAMAAVPLASVRAAWCNPPFASIDPWVETALAAASRSRGMVTWLLVPARTDRPWWTKLVLAPAARLTCIEGRVTFDPPEGINLSQPGSGVVLWQVGGSKRLMPPAIHLTAIMEAGR